MMGQPIAAFLRTSMLLFLAVSVSSLTTPDTCSLAPDPIFKGILVNCSDRGLTRVPHNLPDNTTSLDLSHNNIAALVAQDINMTTLRYLDLSHNKIDKIESGAFLGVANLQELYVNDNRLNRRTCYKKDAFTLLRRLLKLHMHMNHLSGGYPKNVIEKLTGVEELKIDTFSDRDFTFGPEFSKLQNLKRFILGFQGCGLSFISNDTFKVFENVTVKELDLQYCKIYAIDKNAFWYLHSLDTLLLSNAMPLSPKKAIISMYGLRGKRMKVIKINHIFQQYYSRLGMIEEVIIGNDVLDNFQDVCVETFEMVNVKLTWLGDHFVTYNSTLASCIKYINLSSHLLLGNPKLLIKLSLAPNLVSLNLMRRRVGNEMKEICQPNTDRKFNIRFPKTLEYLNLQGISDNVGCFYNITFHNAESLKYLDISYCGLEGYSGDIEGLEGITYLDISGNNFAGIDSLLLNNLPKLKQLIMSDVQFDRTAVLSSTAHMLIPLQYLNHIDLSLNNLKIINPNLFKSKPIQIINLSNNKFETIPFYLTTTPRLSDLDLSFNSLSVFSESDMALLDILGSRNNLTLNLKGNLLSCGCKNLDFIRWQFSTTVRLNYGVNKLCLSDNGSLLNITYVHEHIDETWQHCNSRLWLSISVSVLALVVLTMATMYVIYRRKTWLLNAALRLFGIKNVGQIRTKDDFVNDAYIGYSDADYQYICHSVRQHLEDKHELRLFIRDRDTTPGRLISHEIIRGIDSSWRCVLFLSKAFLEDNWCDFTMEYLVYVSGRRPSINIILILCDDVMRGDISPALLNVVEERRIYRVAAFHGEDGRLWKEVSQCINTREE